MLAHRREPMERSIGEVGAQGRASRSHKRARRHAFDFLETKFVISALCLVRLIRGSSMVSFVVVLFGNQGPTNQKSIL